MQSAAQKTALRVLAIILIIGGILMMFIAGQIREENAPRRVQINGEVVGYLGGNQETDSEMNALTGIGVISAGIGVAIFAVSAKIKQNQENAY